MPPVSQNQKFMKCIIVQLFQQSPQASNKGEMYLRDSKLEGALQCSCGRLSVPLIYDLTFSVRYGQGDSVILDFPICEALK